jgi:hypothetical protein
MPTLLLSPRYTDDSRALRLAAEQAGWQVFRLANWRPPARPLTGEIVLYGEPLLVDIMASALDLVVLDAPPDWLARLPERYTRRTITYTTLAEARTLATPRFVKPALSKSFPAGVYTMNAEIPRGSDDMPGDTPVLVADPVHWSIEFRCFVLDRQIATMSPYLRDGELVEDEQGQWIASEEEWREARAYGEQLLADPNFDLPPAIVLDIGLIASAGWAVIETNGAWGAGLYGCDPASVLPVLRCATSRATPGAQAQPWARPRVEVEY